MQNLTLKYEEMPKSIVAFYTKILNNEYIILNSLHSNAKVFFATYACLYYKENNYFVGKIELSDLKREDFEPIIYAKEKLKEFVKE